MSSNQPNGPRKWLSTVALVGSLVLSLSTLIFAAGANYSRINANEQSIQRIENQTQRKLERLQESVDSLRGLLIDQIRNSEEAHP